MMYILCRYDDDHIITTIGGLPRSCNNYRDEPNSIIIIILFRNRFRPVVYYVRRRATRYYIIIILLYMALCACRRPHRPVKECVRVSVQVVSKGEIDSDPPQ